MQAYLNGVPVIGHVLRHAAATGMDLYVITRPEDVKLHSFINHAQIIHCTSGGLGESIAAGVRATESYDGWIISLGDMPWIETDSFQAVERALEHAIAVRPIIGGISDHPVGFRKECFLPLTSLCGDRGVKSVLDAYPTLDLRLKDQGCLRDIDRPSDLTPVTYDSV